ncbi:MaoC family dehydratase [Candidatus Mycobacterium wuenschmannii]|uniref:MaoC family dehydratase n=1 Tax=Candidatus Mycobacterium wuenschmannii TaxID=3027808 RepID=A0ABY8VWN0_9MYCO|nr:MaoC family dehydratase [Candidatus Mycobacterium wuenschmannii]WIM87194.1 MaoC family dehydratase [Candidatus Mycobacterium wuenschmannii]
MSSELWLDDIHVGYRFRTDDYELTADDIVEFATKWDPQPFHVSEDTARETFFKSLAASGWHTAAITMRLLVTSGMPVANGIIGAGGEVAWPTATRPGDKLHVEAEIVDVQAKPNATRGFVTIAYDTVNQDGEIRQSSKARLLVFAKQ